MVKKIFDDCNLVYGRFEPLLDYCKDKTVLHIGCVDEGLTLERLQQREHLHLLIDEIAKELWGVDISVTGLETLRQFGLKNLVVGNAEKLDEINFPRNPSFDVIIASELIEHLENPGLFLETVKSHMNEETLLVISTPNAYRFANFLQTSSRKNSVHPDHTMWFCPHTLSTLLERKGFIVQDFSFYYFSPYSSNPLLNALQFPVRLLKKGFLKWNPFWSDGMLVSVRRSEPPTTV